jgi:hypothetical protein
MQEPISKPETYTRFLNIRYQLIYRELKGKRMDAAY